MNIFTNKDIKRFFILLCIILGVLICLLQFFIWRRYGSFDMVLLLMQLLLATGILGGGFLYFRKQNKILEQAIVQIDLFLSGAEDVRLECDDEGSLYKLFHAVNTLATTLAAHAEKEQQNKEFLKNTISDISHQLKTPLAALSIYNSILQDDSSDEAVIREFTEKSEQEIDRIESLVQSLLKITRLDAGIIVMERHMEKLAGMMEEIRLRFETRAEREKKTVTLSGTEDVEIFCDRQWIMEAISNIVKNALDHTDEQGEITIRWKKTPTVTQIIIKDTGNGIHPEDIHHIFKRFYRSRFSQDIQGIGLGLPLTKAILEAHDGNITVESVLGEGSTFIVSFLNYMQNM